MNSYPAPDDRELDDIQFQIQQSRQRRMARRKQRLRRRRLRMLGIFVFIAAAAAALLLLFRTPAEPQPLEDTEPAALTALPAVEIPDPVYTVRRTADTQTLGDEITSPYAVVIDAATGAVLAEKEGETVMNPASMTKILTLLVAVEHIQELDQTFTMHIGITDYCFVNGCSVVGYELGEVMTARELLYGCILPSGADACLALAELAAGSHEAFVDLMNEKLEELGLSATARFTNCVGLYDEQHRCTVQDMALILKAALDNELCREVLSTKKYATALTEQHPDGQNLSNWFLRRIEDLDTGALEVRYAKTGYVNESGSCAASCGETEDGARYLCVTAGAGSSWQAIRDHEALYNAYCQPPQPDEPEL